MRMEKSAALQPHTHITITHVVVDLVANCTEEAQLRDTTNKGSKVDLRKETLLDITQREKRETHTEQDGGK